jgi:hypothetical protein
MANLFLQCRYLVKVSFRRINFVRVIDFSNFSNPLPADGTAAVYSEIDTKELRETGEHDLKFAGLKSVFSVSLPLFLLVKGTIQPD